MHRFSEGGHTTEIGNSLEIRMFQNVFHFKIGITLKI